MGRGRGRVELRRIENSVSRQVTFSKRRRGLAKKAHELAVLCDADVALLVFSDRGRLYHYATHASMDRVLDRYERHLLSEAGHVMEEQPELQGNMSHYQIKMRARVEALQKSQRNLMGEQLDSLTLREVQQLEHQIGSALRNIRSRKNHLLLNSVSELQKKERLLMGRNSNLEKEKSELEASLHKNITSPSTTAAASIPNLNIRGLPGSAGDSEELGPMTTPPGAESGLPWWMLRPSANGLGED
ncbi:hypothetical protein ACP70R_032663 [Stipagrostis hirtigluma subsp. patula]